MTEKPSETTMQVTAQATQSMELTTARSRGAAPVAHTEVRIKGEALSVPSVEIGGRTVITTGNWLRVAAVRDEELVEGETVADPESFISRVRESGLNADLFTFAQRLPDVTPKHGYHIEWENAAAIPITSYAHWWKAQTEYSIRKGVNRAKKLGVTVTVADFNDQLAEAICRIYNESPVRQGKAFWHYGKDYQSIRRALATYLDRSLFIGAYYDGELIGFMKTTSVNGTATMTQILSAKRHFDKRPNNALIAKAVEICESQRMSHLIYGSFVYYDPDSSLTEFKRRSGFEAVPLPRYYVPLTAKGNIALKLGLQRGVAGNVPRPLFRQFLKIRSLWYARRSKSTKENV
jgi:hypothetical protein